MAKYFGIAIVATALILGSLGTFIILGMPTPQGSSAGVLMRPAESQGIEIILQPKESHGFGVILQPKESAGIILGYPSVERVGFIHKQSPARAGFIH